MYHVSKRSIQRFSIGPYSVENNNIVGRVMNATTQPPPISSSATCASISSGHLQRRRNISHPTICTISMCIPAMSVFSNSGFRMIDQRNSKYPRTFTTEPSSAPSPSPSTEPALATAVDTAITTVIDDSTTIASGPENQNNPYEEFQKLLYDDGAHFEAYTLLTTSSVSSTTAMSSSTGQKQQPKDDDWKPNAYVQLFDAVIVQHRKLVDTYNSGFPATLKSSTLYSTTTATSATTLSTANVITPEQLQTLRQIIQMAEIANNCIEIMEPFLGARNMLYMDRSMMFADAGDYDNDELTQDNVPGNDHHSTDIAKGSDTRNKKRKKKRKEIDLDLTTRCNDVLTAWALTVQAGHRGNVSRSYIRAVPQRAQFLLSRMELTVEDEGYDGMLVPPSLLSYNSVLQTWAFSCEHLRASSAQQIFDKLMSKRSGTAYWNIRPDGESYRYIIWAWALSRERRAAFIATGHLIKMLRRLELGFDDDALYEGVAIEPSIDDYNIVAQAWIRSEEKNSPGKAQSMLKLMERVYKKGVTMLQPDLLCYKCVILAAAKRHDLPELGPLIDETLGMMRDRFIVPDTECFTAAIKTWKNAAIHQPNVTVADQQTSVRRTIELLAEMDVAHNQSMMVSISVSTENINDVLEALTVSTHHSRTSMVEELLDKLSRRSNEGTPATLKATAESFIYALRVWRSIESKEKIARGKAILWRVKDNYIELVRQHNDKTNNRRKDQIVDIFNEFVQLCASYQPRSDQDGLQVLGEALDAIRVMRFMDTADSGLYHKLRPNASTFASLITAVTILLSPGCLERRVALENIFNMCCTDGMVDDNVLRCFRDASTPDQFATMVEAQSEVIEGMKVVPESWTVNALSGKVKTVDGRKTVPLGIDGLLKTTMAMKQFQMRRLLDHRNRDLLRGGRWQQESKYQQQDADDTNHSPGYRPRKPWKLYDATLMASNQS